MKNARQTKESNFSLCCAQLFFRVALDWAIGEKGKEEKVNKTDGRQPNRENKTGENGGETKDEQWGSSAFFLINRKWRKGGRKNRQQHEKQRFPVSFARLEEVKEDGEKEENT